MLTQLEPWPMRRKHVDWGFPDPKTGQPRKSEPQDQRLPSEARINSCLSPRTMAGVPGPTGSLSLPGARRASRTIASAIRSNVPARIFFQPGIVRDGAVVMYHDVGPLLLRK